MVSCLRVVGLGGAAALLPTSNVPVSAERSRASASESRRSDAHVALSPRNSNTPVSHLLLVLVLVLVVASAAGGLHAIQALGARGVGAVARDGGPVRVARRREGRRPCRAPSRARRSPGRSSRREVLAFIHLAYSGHGRQRLVAAGRRGLRAAARRGRGSAPRPTADGADEAEGGAQSADAGAEADGVAATLAEARRRRDAAAADAGSRAQEPASSFEQAASAASAAATEERASHRPHDSSPGALA